MEKESIPFSETHSFPPIIIDYLNRKPDLEELYKYFPEKKSFQNIIADKKKNNTNRQLLVDVLKKQYQLLTSEKDFDKVQKNIDSLLDENTFTVITGHQLTLCTGPLFFIYKVITTINLTEELKKEYPSDHFVPVFWMASEDHDFKEINHIHLFGKTVEWNQDFSQATGTIPTERLQSFLDDLKSIVGDSDNAKVLMSLFEKAYLFNSNLADATRFLVNHLFAKYGLVIIDGNDPDLKKSFVPIIKDELLFQNSEKKVNIAIEQLSAEYKIQVKPRNINLFYLGDDYRERIVKNEDGRYEVISRNIYFTQEELLTQLETHPELFSPNVILRPVYQEFVLPNLAYIGGPGEISYWLELKGVFDYLKVSFPVLQLRNCAVLVDETSTSKLKKLGIAVQDLFKDIELLLKEFVFNNSSAEIKLENVNSKVDELFSELLEKVKQVDQTLAANVESEKQKLLNAISGIESKLVKAEKKKQEVSLNQLKKIKDKFFPEGELQERYDNFIPYYLSYGENFVTMIKESLDPFDKDFTILYLPSTQN